MSSKCTGINYPRFALGFYTYEFRFAIAWIGRMCPDLQKNGAYVPRLPTYETHRIQINSYGQHGYNIIHIYLI